MEINYTTSPLNLQDQVHNSLKTEYSMGMIIICGFKTVTCIWNQKVSELREREEREIKGYVPQVSFSCILL